MQIRYADQKLEKSIFLAGPTPRTPEVASWRPEAISILRKLDFAGTVLVPESSTGQWQAQYLNQIYWEWEALNQATVIAFWVPRELAVMPAFTTNVEFGLFAASSKVLLGYPQAAPKVRYLQSLAHRYHLPVHHTLHELLQASVERAERGFALP